MSYLYEGWLKIKERVINGRRFEVLIDKEAVGAIVEDDSGRILVVRQFRPALMTESLEIPAGCFDKPDLSPEQILIEELAEEAHLDAKVEDLEMVLTIYPQVGCSNSRYFLYYMRYKGIGEDGPIDDDADVTEMLWLTRDEFLEKIKSGEIKDAKSQLAFFYLLSKDKI